MCLTGGYDAVNEELLPSEVASALSATGNEPRLVAVLFLKRSDDLRRLYLCLLTCRSDLGLVFSLFSTVDLVSGGLRFEVEGELFFCT